ncbi:MAG TPA: type IV pilus secretin family protein [Thiotrichaceae bacterium]|nr:type IV pilus secretin family protein [Thiotrichaceae bacterium]
MIPLFVLKRLRRVFQIMATGFLLLMGSHLFLMPNAVALESFNRLEKIGFSTMPGNRVQIQLNFARSVQPPQSFSTDNPARIVLDFPDTKLGLKNKSQTIGIGVVQSTRAVEAIGRTRIVIKLVAMVPYDIQVGSHRVLVTVENMASKSTMPSTRDSLIPATYVSPPPTLPVSPVSSTSSGYDDSSTGWTSAVSSTPSGYDDSSTGWTSAVSSTSSGYDDSSTGWTSPTRVSSKPVPRGPHIQDVDFQRTSDGAGRIAITLSDPAIVVDMYTKGQNIVLEFPHTALPKKLDRRLDVLDFATPISFIDTFPLGSNVRMNITAQGNFEHHAYQKDNLYVIEVKEKVELKKEEIKIEERKYEGQLVSFNFQDVEVRAVLSLLFDLPWVNMNMIASQEVSGSITLRLKNIPWDQALDIILEAKGLGMRKLGNVVMIDLKNNIDERKQRELSAQKKIKELEPLHTEFIKVNYAKANDLASLLHTRGQHSFVSQRGNVSTDERTNTLIIQETASKISEIRNLINSLDTPIRQVLIESRLVIANSNFSKGLGVKFGYSANEDLGQGNGVVFGGKVGGDTLFSGGTGFTSDNTLTAEGQGENFIVSLPAIVEGTPASLGLAIGKIGSYLLQLELSAMQSEGSGEIISSPRIITGNQQEAIITQGTEIPYIESAGVGAVAQVQFKQAVLELKVTPQITPDDRINMELSIKKDSVGARINGNISIDKREVKTNVLVDNGDTVVLGGVYERSSSNNITRVPFLSDLPLIGNLFKRRSSQDDKSELLIFITPRILKGS